MKSLLNIPLLVTLGMTLSCNNQSKQTNTTIRPNTVKQDTTHEQGPLPKKKDHSSDYSTTDPILILTEMGDTIQYSKEQFNQLIDNHPELTDKYPQPPDQVYYCHAQSGEFGSEAGQDSYYLLYAYFLKKKNGIDQYVQRRKNLLDIYSRINSLFGHLQYGGTYFGHQGARIEGYAEYSVYLYSLSQDHLEKTYDIKKQKSLYIQSLRQLVKDENSIDSNTNTLEDQTKRYQELNRFVDDIDRLVTDNFYLRRAQEFQYGYYEYY